MLTVRARFRVYYRSARSILRVMAEAESVTPRVEAAFRAFTEGREAADPVKRAAFLSVVLRTLGERQGIARAALTVAHTQPAILPLFKALANEKFAAFA